MSESATCDCGAKRQAGYTRDWDMEVEFWVCGDCRRPTKMYLDAFYARLMHQSA